MLNAEMQETYTILLDPMLSCISQKSQAAL